MGPSGLEDSRNGRQHKKKVMPRFPKIFWKVIIARSGVHPQGTTAQEVAGTGTGKVSGSMD